jgi:hypothetical protein
MSPNQKAAWTNLAIVALTLGAFLVAVPLLAWWRQEPWTQALGNGLGMCGLLGFIGFSRLYYKPVHGRPPLLDERDKQIEQRSRFIAFSVFWVVWVFGSVGAWAVLRRTGWETVPVDILPVTVWIGGVIFVLAQSVAILVQYGRSSNNGA